MFENEIKEDQRRTILIVEDNEMNREILVSMLESRYQTLEAEDGQKGLDALWQNLEDISLVLLDVQMPVLDGYGFLQAVRNDKRTQDLPIIVCTSLGKSEEERLLLKGATDFVSKPYNRNILLQRIANIIEMREQRYAANVDALTKLPNRRGCSIEVMQMMQEQPTAACGLVDIRRYKKISRELGASAADRLLQQLTGTLQELFPGRLIARIGIDEFVVLDTHVVENIEDIRNDLQTIFKRINEIRIDGNEEIRPSFCFATTRIDYSKHHNFDDLYRTLTEMMGRAKSNEGNYAVFDRGEIPDLMGIFKNLQAERCIYNRLNEQVFSNMDNEESWLDFLHRSALMKESMCARNQQRINQVRNYFETDHVADSDYDLLFSLIRQHRETIDFFLIEFLIGRILLPHYEKLAPRTELVRGQLVELYLHFAESLLAIYHMGDTEQENRSIEYLFKAIEEGEHLSDESPFRIHYIYAMAYCIGMEDQYKHPMLTESFRQDCYNKLCSKIHILIDRPDHKFHHLDHILFSAYHYPVLRAFTLRMQESLTPEEQAILEEHTNYVREHNENGIFENCPPIYGCQLLSQMLVEHVLDTHSPHEQFIHDNLLLDSLTAYSQEEIGPEIFTALFLNYYCVQHTLTRGRFSFTQRHDTVCKIWETLIYLLKMRRHETTDYQSLFLAVKLITQGLQQNHISYEEKYHYLFKSITYISLDTYSHSRMMSYYAEVITQCIIDHRPELLVGQTGYMTDIETVRSHREQAIEFVKQCCLLHDIGKMQQIPIISNSYRQLTKHEFRLLRLHPELGVRLLATDPEFNAFNDIILGHHKWHDGSEGYPAHVDNTKTKHHVILDIISICDSLEASTSRIGRNYRQNKHFSDQMDELVQQAGTRYNLDVIYALMSDRESYIKLRNMVEVEWKGLYHRIYQEVASE